jgi:hypothetical protein
MSDPTTTVRRDTADETWLHRGVAGAVGGLAGGIAMGLVLQFGTDLLPVIGRVTGEAAVLRGWLVHLATSVVFGLLFAVFVSTPLVRDLETDVKASALLGVVHASALAFVTIGVLLPAATVVLGLSDVDITPHVVPGPGGTGLAEAAFFGLAHVVYGVALGVVYAVVEDLDYE